MQENDQWCAKGFSRMFVFSPLDELCSRGSSKTRGVDSQKNLWKQNSKTKQGNTKTVKTNQQEPSKLTEELPTAFHKRPENHFFFRVWKGTVFVGVTFVSLAGVVVVRVHFDDGFLNGASLASKNTSKT